MRVLFAAAIFISQVSLALPTKADLVVDTFGVGPQIVVADSSNGNVSNKLTGLDPNQVFDGQRLLVAQGAMSAGFTRAQVDTAMGVLKFESFNPAYTNQFLGRAIVSHLGGGRFDQVDLSAYANHSYVIDFNSTSWAGAAPLVDLQLASNPGDIQSVAFSVPESATPFSVSVPLSQFSRVDFANVFRIELDIARLGSNASFEIDGIRLVAPVPEPNTAALLVFVLATSCLRRQRGF